MRLASEFSQQLSTTFLSVMRESGLTLKLEKSKFAAPEITFVGHVIGSGRYGVDHLKVACVETMKPSSHYKEGSEASFFSYFRTYIDRFAELARPLTDLTKKQVQGRVQWTEVHQEAFDKLKKSLCDATKLHVITYAVFWLMQVYLLWGVV